MPEEGARAALDMMNYGMYVIGSRGPAGMNVMGTDPSDKSCAMAFELGVDVAPLDEVLARSDFIAVTCPRSSGGNVTRVIPLLQRRTAMAVAGCFFPRIGTRAATASSLTMYR